MRIKLLQLLDWNSENWKFEILRIQKIKIQVFRRTSPVRNIRKLISKFISMYTYISNWISLLAHTLNVVDSIFSNVLHLMETVVKKLVVGDLFQRRQRRSHGNEISLVSSPPN